MMKFARPALILSLAAVLISGGARGPEGSPQDDARLADQHLSAIRLLQRWAQAIYRFLPSEGGGRCVPHVGEWVDHGDGTFTQRILTDDCTRIINTNYGGSSSDYDQDILYSDGIRERVRARTAARFNGGPGILRVGHVLSTGDRVTYLLKLYQDPGRDRSGKAIPRLNFWYGQASRGRVELASGEVMDFELLQTKAFSNHNFLGRRDLSPEATEAWFDRDPRTRAWVPKPDRLRVEFSRGTAGTLTLDIPTEDPTSSQPSFRRTSTGELRFPDGRRMALVLLPAQRGEPGFPRWKFWRTRGAGYEGMFELAPSLAGRGQVLRQQGSQRSLAFAARWDRNGVGTVVLSNGQARPGGPTGGALEFGTLRWSGMAAALGPTPGL
jgi:hypothetical protein